MKFAPLVLLALGLAAPAQVRFDRSQDQVRVTIEGRPFTTFFYAGGAPKPYLHPLTTASGKRITRAWQMETVGVESHDHPHHRGLWFTHGDVNGFDFWVNEKETRNEKTGVIAKGVILKAKDGASSGLLRATFEWQSPDGKPLLKEDRTMTFHAPSGQRVIDFDVTFTALDAITFGDSKEGFFALRLRDELTETNGTGRLVNAEGGSTMKDVWGKRSPWVDYSGRLEGEDVGVAIFDHPRNPKHPTFWHARDYGLFAANPFGEREFKDDKSVDGSLSVKRGESLRFRYRVVIHPGDVRSANIAAQYAGYAAK